MKNSSPGARRPIGNWAVNPATSRAISGRMSNFEAPLAGAGLLRLDGATAQVPATTLVSFDNADHTAGSLNFDGQLTIGGNGNGMIEGGDYGVWQTRFGQNADSGSVASRFIRKPAVPLLLPIGQWAVSMRENFWQRQVR